MATATAPDNFVFELDALDRYRWRWALDHVDGLAREAAEWTSTDPSWPALGAELVARLHSGDTLEQVEAPVAWAERAHRTAEGLPEWAQLLEICEGDRWAAAASGAAVARAVLDVRAEELRRRAEQAAEQAAAGRPAGSGSPANGSGPGTGEGAEGAPEQGGEDNAAQARADALLRQAVREAARRAIGDRLDERDALEALGVGWGTSGTGSDPAPAGQREELAARLRRSPTLRRLAARVGRLLRSAASKRRTSVDWSSQVLADVTTGRDLARMLPAELALVGDPDLELEFARRFAEGRALCYRLAGREPAERGPMIVAVDCSGSMRGDRMEWAAALALALVGIAVREGRPAWVVPFDTAVREVLEVTRANLVDAVHAIAAFGANGGTDWTRALDAARFAGDLRTRRADVVLVTDGECQLPAAWREGFSGWLRSTGATLFAVLVGEARTASAVAALEGLATVHRIDNLAGGAEVDVLLAATERR